jgi:hypothetical protein
MLPFYVIILEGPYSKEHLGPWVSESPLDQLQSRANVIRNIAGGDVDMVHSVIYVDPLYKISSDVTREIAFEIMENCIPDNEEEWTHWEGKLWHWANKKIKANGAVNV